MTFTLYLIFMVLLVGVFTITTVLYRILDELKTRNSLQKQQNRILNRR